MDEPPKPEEKYDLGAVRTVPPASSFTEGENMFFSLLKQMTVCAVKFSLKSRVWENYKHGSVGAVMGNELETNFMENLP